MLILFCMPTTALAAVASDSIRLWLGTCFLFFDYYKKLSINILSVPFLLRSITLMPKNHIMQIISILQMNWHKTTFIHCQSIVHWCSCFQRTSFGLIEKIASQSIRNGFIYDVYFDSPVGLLIQWISIDTDSEWTGGMERLSRRTTQWMCCWWCSDITM